MKSNVLISVIIPAYNAGKYIERCISSVLEQSFRDFEMIIIDDGSTDDTSKLCDGFACDDSRVSIIHQKNQGAVASRKLGLSIAEGLYACFIDADDWIEKEMLDELYRLAIANDSDVVISGTYLERNGSNSIDPTRFDVPGVYHQDDSTIVQNIIYSDDYKNRGISSSLWNKLFRMDLIRGIFERVDNETRFSEDEICVYGCLLKAKTVVLTDKAYYHYCRNADSLTMSDDKLYFYHADLFYDQMKSILEESDYKDDLMNKLNRYMVEIYSRGINSYRGLGVGNVIPILYPDLTGVVKKPTCRVVLYGASDVGKSFYRSLSQNAFVDVVAWTDKHWDEYLKNGVDLDDITCLNSLEFDYLIICVESEELSKVIREELVERYSIKTEKIYWKRPIRLAEMI